MSSSFQAMMHGTDGIMQILKEPQGAIRPLPRCTRRRPHRLGGWIRLVRIAGEEEGVVDVDLGPVSRNGWLTSVSSVREPRSRAAEAWRKGGTGKSIRPLLRLPRLLAPALSHLPHAAVMKVDGGEAYL